MTENCKVNDCQQRLLGTEIEWLKSSIVSLLILAEADNSPLTNAQVATICKHTLAKYPPKDSPPMSGVAPARL